MRINQRIIEYLRSIIQDNEIDENVTSYWGGLDEMEVHISCFVQHEFAFNI